MFPCFLISIFSCFRFSDFPCFRAEMAVGWTFSTVACGIYRDNSLKLLNLLVSFFRFFAFSFFCVSSFPCFRVFDFSCFLLRMALSIKTIYYLQRLFQPSGIRSIGIFWESTILVVLYCGNPQNDFFCPPGPLHEGTEHQAGSWKIIPRPLRTAWGQRGR